MCTLAQVDQQVVEKKVTEFMNSQKMFTSVHIANAIKMDGKWLKNSDVADWLRENADQIMPMTNYRSIVITVASGQSAFLYFPCTADHTTFTDTNISAMTPDEFKKMHGRDPFNSTPVAAPMLVTSPTGAVVQCPGISASTPSKKKVVLINSVSTDHSGRIRIPAKIVKAIGLKPYKKVTDKKFAIKNIPTTLKVHADGRVSIPRDCTNVKSGPIKIFLKDGMIGFEKA